MTSSTAAWRRDRLPPPRPPDQAKADDRESNAAVGPRHLTDHEAALRIGKVAGALADPEQADQRGNDSDDEQGSAHCHSGRWFSELAATIDTEVKDAVAWFIFEGVVLVDGINSSAAAKSIGACGHAGDDSSF